jgi:cardiolipin synthase A/B
MFHIRNGGVLLPLWVVAVIALALIAMVIMIWSIKRKRRPHLKSGFKPGQALHCTVAGLGQSSHCTVAGLGQSSCVSGNRVELIQNGQFFDRLFADLEAARATINFETFLAKDGEVTRKLTSILEKKAREGVEVRLLLDGSGGKEFGKKGLETLTGAGCCVGHFHPFGIKNLGRINNRTHRKIVVIDGRIGYVGGHCLVDTWLGNADSKEHFRDITARVEGPVMTQLQAAFTDNWIEETGEVIGGDDFFPKIDKVGEVEAHVVYAAPPGGPSTLKVLHYVAIKAAKKSITIQNPYFLPDPDARQELVEAVKRGVDVRIMIPHESVTDSQIVQHASHHHYGTLLKGGVKIYDYKRTLLHQKVFTIDGEWSSVGSTNFDDRSFEINEEISLVIFDRDIARQLEETFEADLAYAEQRHLEEWKKRPALHKLRDGLSFMLNEQL